MPPNKYLRIKAGRNAKKRILEKGIQAVDVKVFSAAAAGPKWLIMFELDKFLINHFFKNTTHKIHFAGGSIGSWRAMTYCLNDAPQAIERLHHAYVHQSYSDAPFGEEVSAGIKKIVEQALGENGLKNLFQPSNRKLHISVSRATFKTYGKMSTFQKLRFAPAYLVNIFSRNGMSRFFERVIFTNAEKPICLLYTSPSPRDATLSRMPSSA